MPASVIVAGGGHIGKSLAPLVKMMGLRLHVVDDRPEFANKERFPEADSVVVADYAEGLTQLDIRPNSSVVIATRGHREDDRALEAAVRSPAGYVGLVGSRRKTILIYEELLRHGIPLERLQAVHAPVGLDIGAKDAGGDSHEHSCGDCGLPRGSPRQGYDYGGQIPPEAGPKGGGPGIAYR